MQRHLAVGDAYSCWCTALSGLAAGDVLTVIATYEDQYTAGGWRNACITSRGRLLFNTTYNLLSYCSIIYDDRAALEPEHHTHDR